MITLENSITTSVCTVSLRSDGICELRFIESYDVDVAEIHELNKAIEALSANIDSKLILSVPGKYGSVTKEARDMDPCAQYGDNTKALALVLPSIHQKLLARLFFKMVTKPNYTYQFFKTEEAAVKWLLNQR